MQIMQIFAKWTKLTWNRLKELSLISKLRNSLIVKNFELILKISSSSLLLMISKELQLLKSFKWSLLGKLVLGPVE